MASVRQLTLVVQTAKEKEQKAAKMLKQANDAVLQSQMQLTQLNQYRLEYVKRMRQEGIGGLHANVYSQYQDFVKQMDEAVAQQQTRLFQSQQAHAQRKQQWLDAQGYRKAIEKLIEREQLAEAKRQSVLEQKQSDEYAVQIFHRRQSTILVD